MKNLTFVTLLLTISVGLSAQCLQYETKKGRDCGNPNSMSIKIDNNCGSKKYVVALCFDENNEIYKLLSNHVESGREIRNWTCECYNVNVRYWDFDSSDSWAAYRAGQEYIKKCKEGNRMY